MAMLAEPKRKQKWVINPRNKPLWFTDDDGLNYSKKLMEKMGWSAGKGLGATGQGIQEPVRANFKSDTKGLSYKIQDDTWILHNDEFNTLLTSLAEDGGDALEKVSNTDYKAESLEKKSSISKARLHYKKFTRGKDLSRYSSVDLACILGPPKTKEETQVHEIIESCDPSEKPGEHNTSFGVTTINSGSITDYFNSKMKGHSMLQSLCKNYNRYQTEFENEVPYNKLYNGPASKEFAVEDALYIHCEQLEKKKDKDSAMACEKKSENENTSSADLSLDETMENSKKRKYKVDSNEVPMETTSKKKKKSKSKKDSSIVDKEQLNEKSLPCKWINENNKELDSKDKECASLKKKNKKVAVETEDQAVKIEFESVNNEKRKKHKKCQESETVTELHTIPIPTPTDDAIMDKEFVETDNADIKKRKSKKHKYFEQRNDGSAEVTKQKELDSSMFKKKKKSKKHKDTFGLSWGEGADIKEEGNVDKCKHDNLQQEEEEEEEELAGVIDGSVGHEHSVKKKKKSKSERDNESEASNVLEQQNVGMENVIEESVGCDNITPKKKKKSKKHKKELEEETQHEDMTDAVKDLVEHEAVHKKKKKHKRDKELGEVGYLLKQNEGMRDATEESGEHENPARKKKKKKRNNETEEADKLLQQEVTLVKYKNKNPGNSEETLKCTADGVTDIKEGCENDKTCESGKSKLLGKPSVDLQKWLVSRGQSKLLGIVCNIQADEFKGSNLSSIHGYSMVRYCH